MTIRVTFLNGKYILFYSDRDQTELYQLEQNLTRQQVHFLKGNPFAFERIIERASCKNLDDLKRLLNGYSDITIGTRYQRENTYVISPQVWIAYRMPLYLQRNFIGIIDQVFSPLSINLIQLAKNMISAYRVAERQVVTLTPPALSLLFQNDRQRKMWQPTEIRGKVLDRLNFEKIAQIIAPHTNLVNKTGEGINEALTILGRRIYDIICQMKEEIEPSAPPVMRSK